MKNKRLSSILSTILFLAIAFTTVFPITEAFAADANVRLGQTVTIPISQPWLSVGGYNGNLRLELFYDSNLISVSYGGGSSLSVTALKPSDKDVSIQMYWACQKVWFQGLDSRYEDVDGSQSWSVHIITPDPPTSISLPETRTLALDKSATLSVTKSPESSHAEYTWKSSAPDIVSVNNGKITALNPGEATITARSQNGLTASCLVTVPVPELELTSSFPKEGSTDMLHDSEIILTFDRNISEGSNFSSITLLVGDNFTLSHKSISGKQLKVSSSRLTPGFSYTLLIPENALSNQFGKSNKEIRLNFTVKTADIDAVYPDDNSKSVSVTEPITIEYHADMKEGANIDKISLTEKDSGKSVAFSYSISGSRLIVTPKNALSYNTSYQFSIPKGALNNAYNKPFEEETLINFTTILEPLKVMSTSPSKNFGSSDLNSVSVHFNNEISEDNNFDLLKVTELDSDANVAGNFIIYKSMIMFDYTTHALIPGNKYVLTIPAGAVKNASGDSNEAITLYFTEKIPAPSIDLTSENRVAITGFEGAKIYYTTDGSPAENGKLYQTPFSLPAQGSFTVNAIAIKDGLISTQSNRMFTISDTASDKVIITGVPKKSSMFSHVSPVSDGYIFTGNAGSSTALIEKYDNDLNLLWSKTYEKAYYFNNVIETEDMYITTGHSSESNKIIAFDKSGNIAHEEELKGYSGVESITQTPTGFAVAANKNDALSVISYTSDFERIFAKNHQIGESAYADDIISDGENLVIVGHTYNKDSDAFIVKLDSNGSLLWSELLNGAGYDSYNSVIKSQCGYVIVGASEAFDSSFYIPSKNSKPKGLLAVYTEDGEMSTLSKFDSTALNDIAEYDNTYYAVSSNSIIFSFTLDKWGLEEISSRYTVPGSPILTSLACRNSALIVAGDLPSSVIGKADYPLYANLSATGYNDAFIYRTSISNDNTADDEDAVSSAPENPEVKELFILGKEKIEKSESYEIIAFPETEEPINRWTSDASVALFLPDGTVKPLKTGKVTLFAAIGDISTSKEIEIIKDPFSEKLVLTINSTEAKVFGKTVTNDVAPIIENSRTMLPARFVAENLGANVSWDGEKQTVTIENDDTTIRIVIGSNIAYINGEAKYLDSPAFIRDSRTYMPVRFICESLGAAVEWDQSTQSAIISK